MEQLRSFFAIKLDQQSRFLLTKLLGQLKDADHHRQIRWVKSENLHITLRFLGDVSMDDITAIINALNKKLAGAPAFTLEFGELLLFPSPNHPRVIAIDIPVIETLLNTYQSIETGLTEMGFDAEIRPLKPHLTLGRVRNIHKKLRFDLTLDAPHICLPVNDITLYHSLHNSSGIIYKPLAQFKLV